MEIICIHINLIQTFKLLTGKENVNHDIFTHKMQAQIAILYIDIGHMTNNSSSHCLFANGSVTEYSNTVQSAGSQVMATTHIAISQ